MTAREQEHLQTLLTDLLQGDPAVLPGTEKDLAERLATKLVGAREPYRTGRRGFDRLREVLLRQLPKPRHS